MITTINSNGYAALGNRYFGSGNALAIPRVDRFKPAASDDAQAILFFGNLNGQKTRQVQNGIAADDSGDPLPKLDPNPYKRAENILKRLGDIADKVANDTTLTAADRAHYDAEFQQLKQSLRDNGFGSDPTAAAALDPKNAQLKNLQLIASDSNVLTATDASAAATGTVTGRNNLFLQQGNVRQTELELQNLQHQSRQDAARVFSMRESDIQDLKKQADSLSDPAQRFIARYNARADYQFKSSILNVLA